MSGCEFGNDQIVSNVSDGGKDRSGTNSLHPPNERQWLGLHWTQQSTLFVCLIVIQYSTVSKHRSCGMHQLRGRACFVYPTRATLPLAAFSNLRSKYLQRERRKDHSKNPKRSYTVWDPSPNLQESARYQTETRSRVEINIILPGRTGGWGLLLCSHHPRPLQVINKLGLQIKLFT